MLTFHIYQKTFVITNALLELIICQDRRLRCISEYDEPWAI